MNAENFDKLMRAEMEKADGKSRLLLHCCCAPCSSACLERLKDCFSVTVFFYNPNIEDEEYFKRKNELVRLIDETGWAEILDCDHNTDEFYSAVKGLEKEKEGGERCKVCFSLRLAKTAEVAEREGFDYFTTTLTVSPLKDARLINSIGGELAEGKRAKWLPSDFKKRDGYLRSLRLSERFGLYRQNFCGCVYSLNEKT